MLNFPGGICPPLHALRRERRSAVALIFAILAVPTLGLVGLAIDYGIWNQTYASLSLAASGAALNAVKIAAAGELAQETQAAYIQQGVTAGTQWFEASVGVSTNAARLTNIVPKVTITGGTNVVATVSYTGTVNSIFGGLFGLKSYPLATAATAQINAAPYTEVVMMVDNSSSMDIGATGPDIQTLMQNSPCDVNNQFVWENNPTYGAGYYGVPNIDNNFSLYQDIAGGNTYNPGYYNPPLPTYPIIPVGGPPLIAKQNASALAQGGPYSPSTYPGTSVLGPQVTSALGKACVARTVNSKPTYAGSPCAFACHYDSNPAHNGNFQDSFGMARRLGVTLRFDVVKNATIDVLQNMATYDVKDLHNLTVGIYTFDTKVTQVYPTGCAPQTVGCEAADDFATAQTLVGAPPKLPDTADTGIMPTVAAFSNNDDTAFPEAMNTLASTYVTKAGDGTTRAAPRKNLILVTDGFQDDPFQTPDRKAFDYTYCQQFKDMGYTVRVVYTPYYPLMDYNYLLSFIPIVEGTGNGSIPYNLQQCSSYQSGESLADYYIQATNQSQLNAALETFLQQALASPARFTM